MTEDGKETVDVMKERQEFIKLLSCIFPGKQKHKIHKAESKINRKESGESLESRSGGETVPKKNLSTGNEIQDVRQTSYPAQNGKPAISKNERQNVLKILVYDKAKGKRKIFQYTRDVSLNTIGYFRGKWQSSSHLYIHCDITAFRWILRWLQKGKLLTLNKDLLYPVIEAACSLDAPALLTTCLQFWRANARFVMANGEWESLDETVVIGLANLFNNYSLEELTERQLKLQELLYQNFIIFLNEAIPRRALGHFQSLARIFRCRFCLRILGTGYQSAACKFAEVDTRGDVTWAHDRDPDWSLNDSIADLKEQHRLWRVVYWYLWACSHFLYCSTCLLRFPVIEMKCCCYHTKESYHPATPSRTGYFICCGQVDYRFDAISVRTGCQFKEHTPIFKDQSDQEIFKIYLLSKDIFPQQAKRPITRPELLFPGMNKDRVFMEKLSLVGRKKIQARPDVHGQTKKVRRKRTDRGSWLPNYSIGLNQDNQREFEELKIKNIQQSLSGKDEKEQQASPQFLGGSYVNVEAEWWSNLQSETRDVIHE